MASTSAFREHCATLSNCECEEVCNKVNLYFTNFPEEFMAEPQEALKIYKKHHSTEGNNCLCETCFSVQGYISQLFYEND